MCVLIIFIPFSPFVHQKKFKGNQCINQKQIIEILGHRESKHESKTLSGKIKPLWSTTRITGTL